MWLAGLALAALAVGRRGQRRLPPRTGAAGVLVAAGLGLTQLGCGPLQEDGGEPPAALVDQVRQQIVGGTVDTGDPEVFMLAIQFSNGSGSVCTGTLIADRTIATAAQEDRWAELIRTSGLTEQEAEDAIASDAFGALAAELRYAEANHHDVAVLLPRLVASRSLHDAEDVAAVLHARLAAVTARPAGAGRSRRAPRLIAGLIPEAGGPMDAQMRRALQERRQLIEDRAQALARAAVAEHGVPPVGGEPQVAMHVAGRADALVLDARLVDNRP